jgi:hypothetical protein
MRLLALHEMLVDVIGAQDVRRPVAGQRTESRGKTGVPINKGPETIERDPPTSRTGYHCIPPRAKKKKAITLFG